jgi:ParB/RepB/Spo0J family partition protein
VIAVNVPIELIDVEPADHDSRYDTGDVHELSRSIEQVGLLEPVGLRSVGGRYRVIYGFRRIAALSGLGWTRIPAVLVEGEPTDDLLRSLVENIVRKQLSRQERADALERLAATGLGGKEIATRLGMSQNVVWSWLKVGRSKALLGALREDRIGIHQARQMCSLPDEVIAELLPELEGKPDAWCAARIARAVDDARTRPPHGTFKVHAETHTRRSLELILEHCRGIKDISSQREVDLLHEIIDLVGRWQRDLLRARSAPT